MALIVSAFDLVAKVDAIRGGAEAFARAAQNRTFCTDTLLVRVSFMNASYREHFATKVQALCEGPLARVDKHAQSSDVDWLAVGRYAGVDAVWLRDEPRGPLVVPVAWTPGALTFTRREEAEDDAGLQANLALGLLIGGGDLAEALAIAKAAQKRDPTDAITRNLIAYIEDVRAGRKARPHANARDLTGIAPTSRTPPRPSRPSS